MRLDENAGAAEAAQRPKGVKQSCVEKKKAAARAA
jgi:hypothetical protein